MANSFPNCLFAIAQTYPEKKASRRHSVSKWSGMQMSVLTVKSTFTLKILADVIIIDMGTSSVEACHGLCSVGLSSCPLLAGLPHSILRCSCFGSTYPETRVFSCIQIKRTLNLTLHPGL